VSHNLSMKAGMAAFGKSWRRQQPRVASDEAADAIGALGAPERRPDVGREGNNEPLAGSSGSRLRIGCSAKGRDPR
jgi:hypothetical protein